MNTEVYLRPGGFHFAAAPGQIATLLGSCVAITLWHPLLQLGGMCHFMLPDSPRHGRTLDGRYAPDAVQMFLQAIAKGRTRPEQYQAKLFGGGRMFIVRHGIPDIGLRNIETGRRLLREAGIPLMGEHVAGHGHRSIRLDLATGEVWVRYRPQAMAVMPPADKEVS